MDILTFSLRLGAAFLFGAAIGVERQWRQHSAGLRTNTLVSIGAALFIALAIKTGGEAVGRIASYIVGGIGFLGAGVIMKDGPNIKGLNTAATLWCAAAIGSLSGMGFISEAAIGTGIILFIHIVLRPLGEKLGGLRIDKTISNHLSYQFTVRSAIGFESGIRTKMLDYMNKEHLLTLKSLKSSHRKEYSTITAEIYTIGNQDGKMEAIAARLADEKGVTNISWKVDNLGNDL